MLEYNRIGISEEIDVNKTSRSKECGICHFWYFKVILKLVLSMNQCKKLWDLMLLLLMLKKMLTEFTFGIWAKLMQLA